MAINIKFGSITQNKKVVLGVSEIQSYDVYVFVALDTAVTKPIGTKTVNINAVDKSVVEMQTDFKDKIRDWWNKCKADYNKEIQMEVVVTQAITDLEAEV